MTEHPNIASLFEGAEFEMPAAFHINIALVPAFRRELEDGGDPHDPDDWKLAEGIEGEYKFRAIITNMDKKVRKAFESTVFHETNSDLMRRAHAELQAALIGAMTGSVLDPKRLPKYEVTKTDDGGVKLQLVRGYDGEEVKS